MPNQATMTFAPPVNGGKLMSVFSEEGVGANNYVEKLGWKKDYNTEGRVPGDVLFTPTFDREDDPYPNFPNKDEAILLEFSAQAPNGEVAFFAATAKRIYRYFASAEGEYVCNFCDPDLEDTPYTAFAVIAQSDNSVTLDSDTNEVLIDGDLFTLEDNYLPGDPVRMRLTTNEVITRIVESWDYLTGILVFTEDLPDGSSVKEVDSNYYKSDFGTWININPLGYEFSALGHRWEVEIINELVYFNNGADLPVVYNMFAFNAVPLFELRERCIARVETWGKFNGMLVLGDITQINPNFIDEWMNGDDPYGLFIDPINEHRRQWRTLNSPIGDARIWGAVATGSINAGSRVLTLTRPMASFIGETEIVIEGAGPGGSNLSAKPLAGSSNTVFTLDQVAVTSVFDRSVVTCANLEASPKPCFSDIQEDGSAIIRILEFNPKMLVIYKASGIYVGAYTGDADAPMVYDHVYSGDKNIFHRWTLQAIDADDGIYHRYIGDDYGYILKSSFIPTEDPAFATCKDLFFDNINEDIADAAFSGVNEADKEYWLGFASDNPEIAGMVFSYRWSDFRTFDKPYTSFATIMNPFEGTIFGVNDKVFMTGDRFGTVAVYANTKKKAALLNGRKTFFGLGGRLTGPKTLEHDGRFLISSEDYFLPGDVGKFVFTSVDEFNFDVRVITEFIAPQYVRTDTNEPSPAANGGVFESYVNNGITDGYEGFVAERSSGGHFDEIDMERIVIGMGSRDRGADITLKMWGAKNPSDEFLGTDFELFERTMRTRENMIGMHHRKNFFKTRISVKDTLLDARFSEKIFQFKRLKGSSSITRSRR